MFSGIIETLGKIEKISRQHIEIYSDYYRNLITGESISINGVCLTLTEHSGNILKFDVSPQTLEVTTLKYLKKSDYVNMERALKLGDRIGGHLVYGHVDTVASFNSKKFENGSYIFQFILKNTEFLIEKGSVAVNGISLTCFDIQSDRFKVAVIPHTYENTNLKFIKTGEKVNIEYDIIAKYVNKYISDKSKKDLKIKNLLKENGFI